MQKNGKEMERKEKNLSILREARQFSIEKRQQMPKVNTRKMDAVSRIEPLMSSKYLSFAPSVGCDPSQGFFYEKNILSSSKWDYKGYNF